VRRRQKLLGLCTRTFHLPRRLSRARLSHAAKDLAPGASSFEEVDRISNVGISSGNQALTRCAFLGSDLATPTGIPSGLLLRTKPQSKSGNRAPRFFTTECPAQFEAAFAKRLRDCALCPEKRPCPVISRDPDCARSTLRGGSARAARISDPVTGTGALASGAVTRVGELACIEG